METITSKANQYIKLVKGLQDRKNRIESGLCILEGKKIVIEAVKNGYEPEYIFTTAENYDSVVSEFGCRVFCVTESIIRYISTTVTPQAVVGVCKVKYTGFTKPTTNYLVLDSLQDPSNMGAIIRTAVATGFTTIYLINCVDIYNEKVIRSSMGNLFRCKFIQCDYGQAEQISQDLYICDMSGENIFNILTFSKIVGLCIGNEGHGVSEKLRSKVDKVISIPMENGVESLNASVSAGIVMYHIKVNQKEIL